MRYLHEGGFFDRAAKSPHTPQVDVVHGVIGALALLAPEMQVAVCDDVRTFWHLRTRSFGNRANSLYIGAPLLGSSLPNGAISTLGEQLSALIEQFANPDSRKRMKIPETTLIVWRGQAMAAIQTDKTFDRFTRDPESREAPTRPPASVMAVAQTEVFQRIGDLVRESRAEAVRRGITIPVSKAYTALGLTASQEVEPPDQTVQIPVPNESTGVRKSPKGRREKKLHKPRATRGVDHPNPGVPRGRSSK
jgi:hypothetical protein